MQARQSLNRFPLSEPIDENQAALTRLESRIEELESLTANQQLIIEGLSKWRRDHIFRVHGQDNDNPGALDDLIDLVKAKQIITYRDARAALKINKSYFSQIVNIAVKNGEIGIKTDEGDRRRKLLWSKKV